MSLLDWQTLVVAAAVLWAVWTIVRRSRALWRGTGDGCASGGCGSCTQTPNIIVKPLVSLTALDGRNPERTHHE